MGKKQIGHSESTLPQNLGDCCLRSPAAIYSPYPPSEFAKSGDHAVDLKPVRSTVSILRTVLHLLENDPAISRDSETTLEFKRATTKLIAEIEAEHGITEALIRSAHEPSPDSPFQP